MKKFQDVQKETADLLKQWNKLYNEDQQQSLDILGSYAKILHCLGKFQQAKKEYQHLINLRSKTLGFQHPKTLSAIHNLGMNQQRRNNIQDAREILSVAIEGMLKTQSYDDLSILNPLFNFCNVLKLCNQNMKAVDYLEIYIERSRLIEEKASRFQHLFKGYKFLAEVFEGAKKYKEGIQAYNSAIEIAKKHFDKKDSRLKEVIRSRDACKQMIPQFNFYIK